MGDPVMSAVLIEECLREWIDVSEYQKINPMFGCLAQMFTQDFDVVKAKDVEQRTRLSNVVGAMTDFIHKDYHIELLWFMIKNCRCYYAKLKAEAKAKALAKADLI